MIISIVINGASVLNGLKILLVEDSEADIDLLKEVFEEAKVSCQMPVVSDGQEAISYLNKEGQYKNSEKPDMVILDLNLPVKSGSEVLRYLRFKPELEMIPVVILSTSEAEDDILQSYKLEANTYITKPMSAGGYKKLVSKLEEFWRTVLISKQKKTYKT